MPIETQGSQPTQRFADKRCLDQAADLVKQAMSRKGPERWDLTDDQKTEMTKLIEDALWRTDFDIIKMPGEGIQFGCPICRCQISHAEGVFQHVIGKKHRRANSMYMLQGETKGIIMTDRQQREETMWAIVRDRTRAAQARICITHSY